MRRRLCLLLAIVLVAIQLWSSGLHHHALSEQGDDCFVCKLAEQDLPPPTDVPQADLSAAQYLLAGSAVAAVPATLLRQRVSAYLAPYSQAPPARSSRS